MNRELSPEMRAHMVDAQLVDTYNHMIEMLLLTPWWHIFERRQLRCEIQQRGRYIDQLRAARSPTEQQPKDKP